MMSSRPVTPSNEAHAGNAPAGSRPRTTTSRPNSYLSSGPGGASALDQGHGPHTDSSPLSQSLNTHGDGYRLGNQDDSSIHDGNQNMTGGELRRSNSQMSQSQTLMPSKGGTLKKKASLRRTGSMKRSSSRRSSRAGSVRSLALGEKEKYGEGEEFNSAFYTPVPTAGTPTDILANRFQAWRKVLKDLITYFRDVQKSYEVRSKTLHTASNVISNTTIPAEFLTSGGIGDATYILQDFHKRAFNESNRAREMENEVILQLTGLRSDLQQKIKEIKSLSGDFKNSVDKEIEGSRKAVRHLQEALGVVDTDPAATAGKGDPFIVKLGVDRQIERQIEEENYLHRAYLNLESSGRELESIVVGEIQKAYTAYAGILKREADEAFETAEKLREGPLMMAKDHEWDVFVTSNDHMVDPKVPVRTFEHITYPGKDHPAAAEVRSGMLERKSKYLKNYTPGWYVLSPTHLHEFKSADRISSQAPILSLYLPEQKLGSHSEPGSSSHKFMLKGRQTGGMHRGHAWVFRAESYDTMMAWFADIKELTEKSGKERDAFVRRSHARSLSGGSMKANSIGGSSDGGLEEDEADAQPYSSEQSVRGASNAGIAGRLGAEHPYGAEAAAGDGAYNYSDERLETAGWRPSQRPSPGGRFPSDLNVHRGLQAPLSPSSGESSTERDRDAIAAAGALPGSGMPLAQSEATQQYPTYPATESENETEIARRAGYGHQESAARGHAKPQQRSNFAPPGQYDQPQQYGQLQQYDQPQQYGQPQQYAQSQQYGQPRQDFTQTEQPYTQPQQESRQTPPQSTAESRLYEPNQDYAAPATAAGIGGAAIGAAAMYHHNQIPQQHQHQQPENVTQEMDHASAVPSQGTSSPPIMTDTTNTVIPPANTSANPNAHQTPRPASSSQGDTLSLSTVPTSIASIRASHAHEAPQQQMQTSLSSEQIETETTRASTSQPPVPTEQDGFATAKPAPIRTATAGTISDLHIPGEFPKTPKTAP